MKMSPFRQVEKILDEGENERHSVIVHMTGQHSNTEPLLRAVSEAISRRGLIMSARDLLPTTYGRGGVAEGFSPIVVRASEGVASKVSKFATTDFSIEKIRESGLRNLAPLFASNVVLKSIDEAQQSQGSDYNEESVIFWPGNAAFLNISSDDLYELPKAVPEIQGIYPNRRIPPPSFIEVKNAPPEVTAGMVNSWGLQKMNALATWGAHSARGRGVTVGMLDSGVDFTHDDLKDKMKPGGWAEFDAEGNEVPGSQPHDSGQHGTMCAGTIVGGNHSGGWIGVAPEAQLAVALAINGEVGGTEKQALAGLKWLLEQKVDVINMSIGKFIADPETPPVFAEAIYNCLLAGIPTIVAIGNEGDQTSDSPGNDLFAFSVGATDIHDSPAGFSGGRTQILRSTPIPFPPERLPFVYKKPEISAPGVAVKTSLPGNTWDFINGTSIATAYVSGAVALLLSATTIREKTQGFTRTFTIQDLLTGSVEELGESGQDHRFGLGRLDVLRAIGFAYEGIFKPNT